MNGYRGRIVGIIFTAMVMGILLGGMSSYLFPETTTSQITTPSIKSTSTSPTPRTPRSIEIYEDLSSSGTSLPYETPPPKTASLPLPTRSLESTPSPGLPLSLRIDIALKEGFREVLMEAQGSVQGVLTLSPSGSGSLPVILTLEGGDGYLLAMGVEGEGEGDARLFEGVRFTFSPTQLWLAPGERAVSILEIEVEEDAPTSFYGVRISATDIIEGFKVPGPETYFNLLILPYTPSYIFYIHPYTSTPPSQPIPSPTPTQGRPLTSTSPPSPRTPTIKAEAGERILILIGLETSPRDLDPDLPIRLSYTYNDNPPGSLPPGITAQWLSDPFQVTRAPGRERFYGLLLTISPDALEGIHRVVVEGMVGSYSFEKGFNLNVEGGRS